MILSDGAARGYWRFDEETVAIVWATKGEAEELISMTEDPERQSGT
jgi:hypothetical protein